MNLLGTATIGSPLVGSPAAPTAGLYVGGSLSNGGTGSLASVWLYQAASGNYPSMDVFVPAGRVAELVAASKVAQVPEPGETTYNSLTLTRTRTFDTPITVNGSLTIAGPCKYTFKSVYVTGSVLIKTGASVSMDSLYVGGAFTVNSGVLTRLGPTYVAGNTSLTGSGTWDMGLFATNGNLTIGGTQTMGSAVSPVTTVMAGSSRALTYGSGATYWGLLHNGRGTFSQAGTSKIKGSVLCGGIATLKDGASIFYDPCAALILDQDAPSTTLAQEPLANAAGWTNSSIVRITLDPQDVGWSGVAATWYRVDGAPVPPALPYLWTGPFLISGEGTHPVTYWSADNAGNTEPVKTAAIRIDTTAPTVTFTAKPAPWIAVGAAHFAWAGADNLAPEGELRYATKLDSGEWSAYAATTAADLADLAEGEHAFAVKAGDAAGNESAVASWTFNVDTTAPTGEVTINGGAAWTNDASVSLTLSATDGGSGVAEMRLGNAESAWSDWMPYESSALWTLSDGDGDKPVSVELKDAAGNVSSGTISDGIGLDTVAPAAPDVSDDSAWHDSPVSVTAAGGSDPAPSSGFRIQHLEAGNWVDGDTVEVSTEGVTEISFRTVDNAGNHSAPVITTRQIDTTPPAVALRFTSPLTPPSEEGADPISYWNEPVMAVDVSDSGSGETGDVQFYDGDGPIGGAPGDPLPAPLGDGSHTLSASIADEAGNVGWSDPVSLVVAARPFTVQSETPYEGDTIGLYADDTAATGNTDGSLAGKAWEWKVTAGDVDPFTLDGPIAFLTLANAADYDVQLTVTDMATQAKCVTAQTITASAQAPWVDALDVEVLEGQPAMLVARFLDPGWEQTHQAAWSVDGLSESVDAWVSEDNLQAMDSGYVAGVTPALSASDDPYQGLLTVTDSKGASTPVGFTITPVAADPQRDEGRPGSDTIAGPDESPFVRGGNVHLSYIQSAGDVDIFEIKPPDGEFLPYGTEVLVTLRDLPADYDLALIKDLGEDVDPNASLESSSFASASVNAWVDLPTIRKTEWGDLPTIRKTAFEDVPTIRKTDWEELPTIRRTDWEGVPTIRKTPFDEAPTIRKTGWDESPTIRRTPFVENAYFDSPTIRKTPWEAVPTIRKTEWLDDPTIRKTAFTRSPMLALLFTLVADQRRGSLDGYSFSDMCQTGLGSNTASGSELTWASLGFDSQTISGKRIAGVSAHVGTGSETVLVTTDFVGGRLYVAIKGANGAYAESEPYALQVETSQPLDIAGFVNAGKTETPKVPDGPSEATVTAENPGPQTLFVAQPERIDAIYRTDTEPSPWVTTVLPALQAACASPYTGLGEILTIPPTLGGDLDLYDAWDAKPWDVQRVNGVTEEIRTLIQEYLNGDPAVPNDGHPSIKYVVLVGGDDVIPQRRVQDETVLGNERAYVENSWLESDSALRAAMYGSLVLTDDYYVDASPIPYNGRSLYVPDLAVSRLVETPSEIAGAIEEFLENDGMLAGGSAVVTGQDFMSDGATRVKDILSEALPATTPPAVTSHIRDDWEAADAQRDLLDGAADVGGVNAHFNHYGGISAYGYGHPESWGEEFLSSSEFLAAEDFVGKLVFTMGCHAGLNVPDDQVGGLSAGYAGDPDPRLDLAQAMARQRGVLVASTGFGFGDSDTIAGTEALIGNFADQATTADAFTSPGTGDGTPETGQPIGIALAQAKCQYLGSLTSVTPYDEKSSIQFTMYGMPQYRLACDTHEPVQGIQTAGIHPQSAGFDFAFGPADFTLTIEDDGATPVTHNAQLVETTTDPTARYIVAAVPDENGELLGDSQATADRPIQPRVVIDLGSGGSNPVKSAIVTGGTYVDLLSFNPAISRWTTEWEADAEEFQVSTDGWWPEKPVAVRTVETPAGREQRLIVLPGQFLATSGSEDGIIGTERVWTSLTVKLVRGADTDNIPPTVRSVTLSNEGDQWTAHVDAADDASGISRIDVTQVGEGGAAPFAFPGVTPSSGGIYEVAFDLTGVSSEDVAVMVAVTDGAGNVTTATAKGLLIAGPPEGTADLNGGDAVTYSRFVNLDSAVVHAVDMRVRIDGSAWTTWQPLKASVPLVLPVALGDHTVDMEYRNADPTVLEASASIRLASAPMSAGGVHGLVVKPDGSLWAWGFNGFGELGNGTTTDEHSPVAIGSESDWAVVDAGDVHSLALKVDGSLYGWGDNSSGQLGIGSTAEQHLPILISSDPWAVIAAGHQHSLGIKDNGTLWAWGSSDYGQLGAGDTAEHDTPFPIGTSTDWVSIGAGAAHSIALKADGSLWAWGWNNDGSRPELNSPVRVGSDSDWVAIAAGGAHNLALKADGSLWAWGQNGYGQLGDGTTTSDLSESPARVGTDNEWVTISAGSFHSTALKADGSLYAWGWNYWGQLGDGSTTDRHSPVRIGGDNDWAVISAGGLIGDSEFMAHSLGLKADGELYAWGENSYGQIGDGTTVSPRKLPVQVQLGSLLAQPPAVSAPNGGESWVIGSAQEITWSPGSGGAVKIELSRDDGASWETLYTGASNDGSESWTVSGPATSQALARVSNDAGSDTSDADFTIGLFAAKVDYATGTQPLSVAVGDFNGDGKQDLVTANYWPDRSVSVLLGDGSGGFGAKHDYATGSNPCSVAVGDFNGDGKQDLATANDMIMGSVSVLLGSGDGTFAGYAEYATGSYPVSVAVGDLNGDGKQDLATANNNDDTVSVLLGDGGGGFAAKTDFATGARPHSVTVGDFDGDGKQDLVAANYVDDSVSVLLGDGSGGFAAKTDFATGARPYSVAVGDFDGDGKRDLATANHIGNSVSVLLGDGSGGFSGKTDYATGGTYPMSVVAGDLNGDGKQDLATAKLGNDSVSVLLGDGGGGFAAKTDYATGAYPYLVAIGDFNGDGKQDLATANSNGNTVSVLLNRPGVLPGALQFAAKADCAAGSDPLSVTAGDFDGDGKQDLATANYEGDSVSVLLGDGSGGFGAKVDYATGSYPRSVTAGDFNGDGDQDLATANRGGDSVSVLLGDGSGGFGAKVDYATGSTPYSVIAGDFDGDGKQDLAVANYFGSSVSVLLGDGSGGFAAKTDYATGSIANSVTAGDFDGDGKQDLATANAAGDSVSVLLGDGSGGFGAKVDYATGSYPSSIATGDFDGDGDQDLATSSTSVTSVSVLLGDGSGGFAARTDYATGGTPISVTVGDFNGDGKQDLVTANASGDSVSVLLGDGSGGFGAKVDYATGSGPNSVIAGDFNGDGKQDLATANFGSNSVSVLLNTTPQ